MEIWTNGIREAILNIHPLDKTVLRVGVNQVDILTPSGNDILTIAANDSEPLKSGDSGAAQAVGGAAPSIVVLEAGAEVVRSLIVLSDRIELLNGQIVGITPGACTIGGDIHAAIVAINHAVRILGVNPERVMIYVDAPGCAAPGLSAV